MGEELAATVTVEKRHDMSESIIFFRLHGIRID